MQNSHSPCRSAGPSPNNLTTLPGLESVMKCTEALDTTFRNGNAPARTQCWGPSTLAGHLLLDHDALCPLRMCAKERQLEQSSISFVRQGAGERKRWGLSRFNQEVCTTG